MIDIEPLWSKMPDGTPWERREVVKAQIAEWLEMTQSERLAHLPRGFSETLVYFIRHTARADENVFEQFLQALVRRGVRIARSCIRGMDRATGREIVEKVEERILTLLLLKEPNSKSDALELAFMTVLERYVFDCIRGSEFSPFAGARAVIDVNDEDGEPVERPIELLLSNDPGAEYSLLDLNDRNERHQQLRIACRAVEDRLTLKLLILHYGHGWPVYSTDRTRPCLVRHCGLPQRTIYRMLAEGMAAMRKALNAGGAK